jgi:Domain of unknown function (DUF3850)
VKPATTHVLKCDSVWFQRVLDGTKTFEVRFNDRGFQKGDGVLLREISGKSAMSTGREWLGFIGDVFSGGFGADLHGYVVFSLLDEPPALPQKEPPNADD